MAVLWHIDVLGPLRLRRADQTVTHFPTRHTALLLALLAAEPEPVSRDELIHRLWAEPVDARTRARLSTALHRLRRLFEGIDADGPPPLDAHRRTVGLRRDLVATDLEGWQACLAQAQQADSIADRCDFQRLAIDAYTGDFLADYDEPWVEEQRRDYRERHLRTVAELAEQRLTDGDAAGAVALLDPAARHAPVHEPTHRALMRALHAAGRSGMALRRFKEFDARLRRLGNGASPATRRLAAALARQAQPVEPPRVPATMPAVSLPWALEQARACLDEHDCGGALAWFVHAWRHDGESPGREPLHRLRMTLTWQHCPRLTMVWAAPGPVQAVVASPDGTWVAGSTRCGRVLAWSTPDGELRLDAALGVPGLTRLGVDPRSRLLLGAGTDGRVRLWQADSWQTMAEAVCHRAPVEALAVDARGRLCATACREGHLVLLEVESGEVSSLHRFQSHVASLAFSPDGRRLAAGVPREGVALFDLGQEALAWSRPTGGGVHHVAFSHDGSRLVTAGDDGMGQIWDAATGSPLGTPLAHDRACRCALFSADGSWVATGSADSTVRVWEADTGRPLAPPIYAGTDPHSLVLAPDGRWLLAAGRSGVVHLWRLPPPLATRHMLPQGAALCGAAFVGGGDRVVVGGDDGTVRLWSLPPQTPAPAAVLAHEPGCYLGTVHYRPDGAALLTAGGDHTARLWHRDGRPLGAPLQHAAMVRGAAFSPDGALVATASDDGTAGLWSAASGHASAPPLAHDGPVHSVAFSPDSRWLATGCRHAPGYLWDVGSGEALEAELDHRDGGAAVVAFAPDGRLLSGDDHGSVAVWDVPSGRLLGIHPHHGGRILGIVPLPDSERALSYGSDGAMVVWRVGDGAELARIGCSAAVHRAAVSPDGAIAASACIDGSVRLWSIDRGEPLSPPRHHRDWALAVAFSACGRLLVSTSNDGLVRLWEVPSAAPMGPPLEHPSYVFDAAFSPDGHCLTTVCSDGRARIWPLPDDDAPLATWAERALRASARHIDASGALVPASAERLV